MTLTIAKEQRRIAIIGGGPGGLTLALILQKHGIPSVIYEREQEDKSHERGGSLDIHEESGQQALKEAGLYEAFQRLARYEGEDFRLFDKTGRCYMDEVVEEDVQGERPEIDRGELCDLLLSKLDPSTIRYGYKLDKAVSLAGGMTELHFENGFVDKVHLVIGADGTFSRVRPLLSDTDVDYTGLTMFELNVTDAANRYPDLAAFNRRGKMFALDDNMGILAQLNGSGRIKVYVSLKAEREWLEASGITADQPQEAKAQLLGLIQDWEGELQNYIRYADDAVLPRRIYMLPAGFKWKRNSGVTLIGDAAHVMSPFAGEGVNLAMQDAMELALAIVRHEGNTAKAIEEYEEKMYAYSSEKARESYDNLVLCFSDNAAPKFAELMNFYHGQHDGA
ncbi:NAD(P)/FAD-dependent oxidoreductase [Paenibacillus sp. UNC499MF]|uniref:FAD-dependent oxidoreductase n=1 Tax=Paenibacillus sp. UNC499MF TaxID=1502751 RepID=UPI00089FE4F1|nr:NAD(P)/FAD-dependent oxidoreductase [Paenibacillus sp. UNC499MF]SEG58525.1 2-polyprenyl-6-methoxyphenol hydroxylase [Paenibacillus sp. UNC499MF]